MYVNALTHAVYSGKNQQLLAESAILSGIEYDPSKPETVLVAGFQQWLALGRVVAKGQHGTKILMVVDKKDEQPRADGAEPAKRKVLKTRAVFFFAQTVELPAKAEEVAA